ncbi:methionine adenosyltransferase [Geotalea uraniireducens]|uniref:Methionine adenosyltransferase n=2 Tax=Geotalea uraniireducens TaxID=351604 RepID=A5GDZ9_GEOUR|nr:methionine adenosyltransferase [Geotalea uraniireducens]ABQ25648.1 methionine adenosyltransferase [Geotalea uraniireducens Rf4]
MIIMIVVETYKGKSITEHRVEIVERKGTGHPDQICDSIMDAISVALSQEYLREFGTILHHNIDKSLLAAGRVEKFFGGGHVVQPMELIIGDRATFRAAGREIPVAEIAVAAARKWLGANMRFVDPDRHLNYRIVLAPGSEELTDIFARPGEVRVANDTSAAVGYYPLSPTERAVLDLERHLNSAAFKGRYPETGEDVKVMGLRRVNVLELTVAMPLLATFIRSEEEYFARKEAILKEMQGFLGDYTGFRRREVHFNGLDAPGRGLGGVYLSLLGTSAEDADSGQVGRGNRVNGLISMNRPMGTEAAAGKNPVSHVGKIYNVLAHKIAREIFETIDGIKEVYVLLLNRIGTPIDQPQMATAQLLLERGRKIDEIAKTVEDIFEREFAGINAFCTALARGEYPVC